MNFAISGDIGSGKSTICKMFEDTGYTLYYTGKAYRQMAEELDMSVSEFHAYASEHPEVDEKINRELAEFCAAHDNVIIDSRLAFHYVPDAYSVYLECDSKISAARMYRDNRQAERYSTVVECFYDIQKRKDAENERFSEMVGKELSDRDNYNLTINVSMATPNQVFETIRAMYRENGIKPHGIYIPSLHSACFDDKYKDKVKEIHTLTDVLAPYPYLHSRVMEDILDIVHRARFIGVGNPIVFLCDCPEWLEAIRCVDDSINVCAATKDMVSKCLEDGNIVCWRGRALYIGPEEEKVSLDDMLSTCDKMQEMIGSLEDKK